MSDSDQPKDDKMLPLPRVGLAQGGSSLIRRGADLAAEAAYKRGLEECGRKAYPRALEALVEAVRLRPDYAEAWRLLGHVYRDLGEYEEAADAYGVLVRLEPLEAEGWYHLGVAYRLQLKHDDGIAAFRESIRLRPDFLDARTALGHVYSSAGQSKELVDGARSAFLEAIRVASDHYQVWSSFLKHGLSHDALINFRRAVASSAKPVQSRYEDLGIHTPPDLARHQTDVRDNPERPDAWYNLSLAYGYLADPRGLDHHGAARLPGEEEALAGYREEMIASAREAVRLDPELLQAWDSLGVTYAKLGRHELAIEACRQAIRIEPGRAPSWRRLGGVLLDAGRTTEATDAYKEALRLEPWSWDAPSSWNDLAVTYQKAGRTSDAIAALREATQLDPDIFVAWANLAVQLHRQNDHDSVAGVAAQLKRLDPAKAENVLLPLQHAQGWKWTHLDMTLGEWKDHVGDYVLHSGTVLRTARGVFSAVLIGTSYIGQKREDGTVDRSTEEDWVDPPWIEQSEVVVEYADPPKTYPSGCYRTPNGAIRCFCNDES
jgi:tetratricopeptide (TPR) repeat protein